MSSESFFNISTRKFNRDLSILLHPEVDKNYLKKVTIFFLIILSLGKNILNMRKISL